VSKPSAVHLLGDRLGLREDTPQPLVRIVLLVGRGAVPAVGEIDVTA